MHVLGLCNGSIHGNSEVLLKAALKAAAAFDPTVTVSWIHVPSVSLPRNSRPLNANPEIIPSRDYNDEGESSGCQADDREAAFNAIMGADALIIATPVFSHQPAGTLKALADAILGPYADVSAAHRVRAQQLRESGETTVPDGQGAQIDPLSLKPRVAGFIAVAGSSPEFPEQWTMALPTLHSITYPLHARVVDQVVLPGFANAGAILLEPENTVSRAELLGRRVASQIGRPYDDARYLGGGGEEEGSCPYCHLLKLEFRNGNLVVCIVCGANGILRTGLDGNIRPVWEPDSKVSCMTLEGKWKHLDDIKAHLTAELPRLPDIADELDRWKKVQLPMVDLPSNRERSANGKL